MQFQNRDIRLAQSQESSKRS
jgi:hypothetical protein